MIINFSKSLDVGQCCLSGKKLSGEKRSSLFEEEKSL
jgi:hypothetical protein